MMLGSAGPSFTKNVGHELWNHVAALSTGDSLRNSSVLVDDLATQLRVKTITVGGKTKAFLDTAKSAIASGIATM
jgi:hypothetical protein